MDRTGLWLATGVVLSVAGAWLVATAPGSSLAWLFGVWIGLHGLGALAIGAWQRLRDRNAV